MVKYKCIIIDDDHYAVSMLSDYISQTANLSLFSTFTNAETAAEEIRNGPDVDFLFLNIEMPKISGIQLARLIGHKAKFCIFLSAHIANTLDAFDVDAAHFILKPLTLKKFQDTIENVLSRVLIPNVNKPYILIKCNPNTQIIKIFLDTIIYIEGASNYIKIHTVEKSHITYSKMKDMELKLGSSFLRINKSYIISIKYIDRIEDGYILLYNKQQLKIGSTYKKIVTDFVNNEIKGT